MPFLARRKDTDDLLLPGQVMDWMDVVCPSCGSEMLIRESYYNQGKYIPKHFAHRSRGDCEGESSTHLKMKGIAGSMLDAQFETAEVIVEKQITTNRIADLVVEFTTPLYRLGKGIAVEAQYRNKNKQLGRVTQEYLEEGYSVLWVYPDDFDFGGMEFDFPEGRIITQWPNAVPEPPGRELYPDVTPARFLDEMSVEDSPGVVPATFPAIIKRVHQLDIACPVREGFHPEWKQHKRKLIHSKGRKRASITLYGTPQIGSFFELREADVETEKEDFLTVPITSGCSERFRLFCERGIEEVESGDDEQEDRPSSFSQSVKFEYNAGIQGEFSFNSDPDDTQWFSLSQQDVFGCERSMSIPYRNGDFGRIRQILPVLDHLLEPQRPFLSSE